MTFAFKDAGVRVSNGFGKPFQLVAYADEGFRGTPAYGYSLRHGAGDPPAVISLSQPGADLSNLRLYRMDQYGTGWQEATCQGYEIQRFPLDSMILAPVCQAGTFVFAATTPEIAVGEKVYLPLLRKSGQ